MVAPSHKGPITDGGISQIEEAAGFFEVKWPQPGLYPSPMPGREGNEKRPVISLIIMYHAARLNTAMGCEGNETLSGDSSGPTCAA
jgi:hypothetical protein